MITRNDPAEKPPTWAFKFPMKKQSFYFNICVEREPRVEGRASLHSVLFICVPRDSFPNGEGSLLPLFH